MTTPIVLASGNPKKLAEMRLILANLGHEILGLNDLGLPLTEPEETGATFAENARIKALSYAAQTGLTCLADDSGLAVDALAGQPGVLSARYSQAEHPGDLPRAERDELNNRKLLGNLAGIPPERRTARFVCAMCLAGAGGVLAESEGFFEGAIGVPGDVPRGTFGFGYDPLFLVGPGFVRTSAELLPDEKNALSHRGEAARRIGRLIVGMSGE